MKRDVGWWGLLAGKGSIEVLGSQVNGERGEHRWNHLTFTLPVSLWTKGLLSSFHPWSTPHWKSSWLRWHPGYFMMIAWNGLTQNLCLWLPYIYLLRTMRSHTLQSDCSSRHSPSQWWLWSLRHHNVPLCPSTWVSGCWGRPSYNLLTPDTSVCLILGCGDSGAWYFFSWLSDFPSVPLIL